MDVRRTCQRDHIMQRQFFLCAFVLENHGRVVTQRCPVLEAVHDSPRTQHESKNEWSLVRVLEGMSPNALFRHSGDTWNHFRFSFDFNL